MGRDSTESGEDSDLLISVHTNKLNAADNTERKCENYTNQTNVFPHAQEDCSEVYTSFSEVSQRSKTDHETTEHQNHEKECNETSTNIENEKKKYKCTYPNCRSAFVRPNKLRSHLNSHTNKRPYICSEEGCLKSYRNSSHLKRHFQSVHTAELFNTKYECTSEGCGAILKTSQALKKHYKRKHEGLDYKCTECNAMFKKHRQLTLHVLEHTAEPAFSCQKCSKTFETEYQQKRHIERGHKMYKCSVEDCSEGPFPLWSLYRKHMALKHRPDFICDICDRSFPFKFRLQMHKDLHHNASVDNPWKCSHRGCSLTFKEKRYLSQHVRHVHEGVCFTCPKEDCGKKFRWKATFDRHIRLHSANRPLPRPRKKGKQRKDRGKPKRSIAAKLSDLTVPLKIEKHLLTKENVDSEEDILVTKSGFITESKKLPSDISSETDRESSTVINLSDGDSLSNYSDSKQIQTNDK